MEVTIMFEKLIDALNATRRTIVFTEGHDARILEAAARLKKDNLMDVIPVSYTHLKETTEAGEPDGQRR